MCIDNPFCKELSLTSLNTAFSNLCTISWQNCQKRFCSVWCGFVIIIFLGRSYTNSVRYSLKKHTFIFFIIHLDLHFVLIALSWIFSSCFSKYPAPRTGALCQSAGLRFWFLSVQNKWLAVKLFWENFRHTVSSRCYFSAKIVQIAIKTNVSIYFTVTFLRAAVNALWCNCFYNKLFEIYCVLCYWHW